ncbi:MAG: recombination mediator RecR [Deltaproteobacteria bacterium]|nr:recombination mediator RecR [Deltaproteobacteria bacterium]
MTSFDDDPIGATVRLLLKLPGVGEKSARRMAYSLLATGPTFAQSLGEALSTLHERVRRCVDCGTYSGQDRCTICRDARRTSEILCVVARPWDADALERAGSFRGRYHVLHTLLDPLSGMGPEDFPIGPLEQRIREEQTREVILATPPTIEGEATALFLAESLRPLGIEITRLASGVPHGGDLEYIDPITLGRALDGRRGL